MHTHCCRRLVLCEHGKGHAGAGGHGRAWLQWPGPVRRHGRAPSGKQPAHMHSLGAPAIAPKRFSRIAHALFVLRRQPQAPRTLVSSLLASVTRTSGWAWHNARVISTTPVKVQGYSLPPAMVGCTGGGRADARLPVLLKFLLLPEPDHRNLTRGATATAPRRSRSSSHMAGALSESCQQSRTRGAVRWKGQGQGTPSPHSVGREPPQSLKRRMLVRRSAAPWSQVWFSALVGHPPHLRHGTPTPSRPGTNSAASHSV